MQYDQQWRSWVRKLADGDEAVAADFWQRYGGPLNRVAKSQLSPRLERRIGAEDVVQSVCRTFFRRIQAGEFQLGDGDGLWRLLCAITLTKVRMKARFHQQQRRSMDREQSIEGATGDSDAPAREFASAAPTPDELAQFDEQLAALLDGLDDEEQQMVELKLQQFTHQEIADRMGCSERTVRRILQRVQSRLRRAIDED